MTNETGYNGWKNYETWAIALWLDNDYGTYTLMRGSAMQSVEEVLQEAELDYQDVENRKAMVQKASYKLSESISEYIESNNPLASEASVYTDLLNAAIHDADLIEIAEHYLEDDLVDEAIADWDFDEEE